jgi:U2-associated protein SR140
MDSLVAPAQSGLPFNAQPINDNKRMNENSLEDTLIKVVLPIDHSALCLIHRVIEYVITIGPSFEAIIMTKEINNPQFRFLFDNQSSLHVYYRWKLFSILNGEGTRRWRTKPFRMFKNGSLWKPPPNNKYSQTSTDDAFRRAKHQQMNKIKE